MKHGRLAKKTDRKQDPDTIAKGLSMPLDLYESVMGVVATDPELDFSKYVRRLIRADIDRRRREQEKAA